MFKICLLALTWNIDPTTIPPASRDVSKPIVPCVRPAVTVVQPNVVCPVDMPQNADPKAIASALRRWELATRNTTEWSRSQREEFRRRMHEEFNGHTAAAAEQFVGHVQQKSLAETYDWRIVGQNKGRICLEAIARDETERLFYGSLRISLMTETGLPDELVVVSRDRNPRTVWKSESDLNGERIQLVKFEDGIPPAPNAVIRTAASRID